ncbi:isochorismate synthase [Schaalia suimastitidis]|uniref:isochorismate synthase n=1 Tax=Schaalia suimastitidis TaxID=121163 RepID=UPI000404F037|nr:chorismate-binding protein [Schaalia suimastitidis]
MSDVSTPALPCLDIRVAPLPERFDDVALRDMVPTSRGVLAWWSPERTLIGWGCALRIEVEGRHAIREAGRRWDQVRRNAHLRAPEGAPRAPIAFGSFGFAWATPGMLIVPKLTLVETPHGRYVITASDMATAQAPDPIVALDAAYEQVSASPVSTPQGLWTEAGRMSQSKWTESVRRLISRLRSGGASKVVMARDMVVSSALPFDERYLLARLNELYPTTWTYAVEGLIGATPEMLASITDGVLTSRVLAGTSTDGDGDALMANMKERTEHLLAVESVARALSPLAETLEVPDEPTLLALPNVLHLATDVKAQLREGNVLDAVAALHPTAAVCGTPTPLAFDLLLTFEDTRRGRYSGPVGWIDAAGDGEFGIALRCGQLSDDGTSIRVFAGSGIMPDSVPEAELAETRAKMRPVLDALGI